MPTHVIAPTRSFTQVPNEILRNPRLSSDAVRLLAWHVSLPAGSDAPPLSDTARRAGMRTTAFQRAKRELKAEGYVHEWRTQGRRGRWSTYQLVSNVPLTAEEARAVRDGSPPPSGVKPAVGAPERPPVGRSPENTGETTPLPPHHPAADRGAVVLASVAREERRLRLGGREIRQLAPLAGEWLERGATLADVREALTAGLPAQIHSVAGLVRNRLVRKMPEAAPTAPAAPPPVLLLTCAGGCGRVVRGADATATCRGCRTPAADDATAAVEATRRGMAAVREALRGGPGPAAAPV